MELKYEFYINAGLEEVWNALISPDGTRNSFFGSELRTNFQPGQPFAYVGPGNDGAETVHVYGDILEFEPLSRLSYQEHPGPSYHANHAELQSRVVFQLETVGECTKLTLINDQFTNNHPSIANAQSSWWMILSSIKTWVETGKTLNFGW
ncbi:SRPBCC family protein [Paenibacillus sp. FSL H7-0942]|uniref:SRPBCC family protein n=1 Tax=Paenibacillus sp. FSL H7-0942 TaxID=2921444 RepID=UPI0032546855